MPALARRVAAIKASRSWLSSLTDRPEASSMTPRSEIGCQLVREPCLTHVVPPAVEADSVAIAELLEAAFTRPQVKQHVRSHRGPAQSGTGPYGLVDIFDRCHAGFDQVDRLSPKGGLETVRDVAGHFPPDTNGDLSNRSVEVFGDGQHIVISPCHWQAIRPTGSGAAD